MRVKTKAPLTLDTRHLKLINVIIVSGGEVDCDDRALDRFQDDRGPDLDTINGLIEAGIVRQVPTTVDDAFCLRLA